MTIEIKQSSTTYPLVFLMVDSTDHVTGKTGLTPTVTLSKAGAAFGAAAGAVTEIANGWYKVAGNATDNNTLGPLILHATGTAADPTDVVFNVTVRLADDLAYPTVSGRSLDVSATGEAGIDWANVGSPTTAVNLSATNIDVDQVVASVSGAVGSVTGLTAATVHSDLDDIQTRLPAALVGGRIDANVGAISSDATAADNAEAFFDGTGYAGTNNVIPTVTAVTGLTAATVHSDLDDIQARLPAALIGGRIDANVGAISTDATAADNLEAALDGTGGVTITAAITGNITGNLSGSVGSVTGAVGSVTGAVGSVTGNVGGNVVGSVGSVTAAVSLSAGDSPVMQSGTADAGGASTITLQTALGADSLPVGCVVKITSGTGANQARIITVYVNATKVATVDRAWTTNPDATSVYSILYAEAPALSSGLKVTGVVLTDTLTTYTGNTPQTGDSFARLGAPVGASISADVAGVQSDTNDIQTRLPAALVSGRIDASVGAMAANVITAAAIAADAITDAKVASDVTIASVTGSVGSIATGGIAAASFAAGAIDAAAIAANAIGASELATDAVAEISAAVWAETTRSITILDEDSTTLDLDATIRAAVGLAAANLDTQLVAIDDAVDTEVAAIKAVTDKLDNTLELTSDGYIFSVNALQNAPSGGVTAAEIADAVWDEALAGHLSAGSTGEALNAAGAAGDPWTTALPGAYGAGSAGKIIGDNINATISSRATQTSVDTIDDFLDTEVAAIKAKTDSLTFTVAGVVDANVTQWKGAVAPNMTGDAYARLGAPAGASVSADIAAVQADTDNIQTRLPAALVSGRMDASVGAMAADVLTAAALAADAVTEIQSGLATAAALATVDDFLDTEIADIKAYADRTVVRGTSAAGGSTTSFTAATLSPSGAAVDQFKGRIIVFDNATATAALRGQATDITASTSAALPVFTFSALSDAPASGDSFSIL